MPKAYAGVRATDRSMPSNRLSALVTAVRVALAVAGVGVAAATTFELATMPPPPPGSDGFVHGMAAIVGSVVIVLGLGLAALSVVLPALLGRDDPLGFNRYQRLALKAAGVLVVGGFVVGLAFGLLTILPFGVLLWLAFVALAALVVAATLAWRLGEVLVGRLSRTRGEDAP